MAAAVSRIRSKQSKMCRSPSMCRFVISQLFVPEFLGAPVYARTMRSSSARGSTSRPTRAMPVDSKLDRGDAAVERGAIVLDAGRDANGLALDVHGRLQQALIVEGRARPARQRAAGRDGQGRGAGDAGAGRRFASRDERRVREAELAGGERQQRQFAVRVQIAPAGRGHLLAGVDRSEFDPAVRAGLDLDVSAKADGGVDRARAVVKQIERPDVDRASGEIDTCGRGGPDGM